MPKAIDLRVPGLSFDAAMKRLATAPPPPASKPAKRAAKPKRAKR